MNQKAKIFRVIIAILAAILLTVFSAIYQRKTGPTYPLKINISHLNKVTLSGELIRSATSDENAIVDLKATLLNNNYEDINNIVLLYRKYRFESEWNEISGLVTNTDNGTYDLSFSLPTLPPAGKYEYVIASRDNNTVTPLLSQAIIMRFKGAVPGALLISHIILMFSGMLLSSLAAFNALFVNNHKTSRILPLLATIFLLLGGFILGAFVQKYAFGEYWTGIPFGWDLTDNKTLFAVIIWILAVWRIWKNKNAIPVYIASVATLIIFMIPHSMAGSELDFKTMELKK